MKEILLGSSDFQELIENNVYYVDKSLLIKEFVDSGDKVTLVIRPRRWGKSLAMAMLVDFFNDYGDGVTKRDLFKDLAIAQAKVKETDETYLGKYQGKSPVIMLSFKDIEKESNFDGVKNGIALAVSACCGKIMGNKYVEDYLIAHKENPLVEDFYKLLHKKADKALLSYALCSLSNLLYQASSGKKVYIFIDEYDHALNRAFNTPYFAELSDFMKTFFSAGLKDNACLEKALMTGVLRISQSSMLSGLNNLSVYTVLDKEYAAYFGFTEREVSDLLQYYNLEKYSADIKDWYNGYNIGNTVIYNPWSIMNCVKHALRQGDLLLKNYWAESGTNDLIQETLIGSVDEIKEQLQLLSQPSGQLIDIDVDTKVRFDQLSQRPNAFWSLLLATGYLTATSVAVGQDEVEYRCNLAIPNKEVRSIFNSCVKGWLEEQKIKYLDYWKYLVNGEVDKFIHALKNFLASTASTKDAKNHRIQLENFYHGFMLGLSFGIHSHIVKSNVESGYGIYDLLIKPKVKKPDSLGIVLEFKIPRDHETLTDAAQKGLDQIIANQYVTELEQEGYQDILVVGISFVRKDIACLWARGKNSAELKENGQKS